MENVEVILNKVVHETNNEVVEELAKIIDSEITSYLIENFDKMTEAQKITIVQVPLFKSNKFLIRLLEEVEKSNELFFVKQIARGVLDELSMRKEESFYKKIIKRYSKQSSSDKVMDLSYLGNINNPDSKVEILQFLKNLPYEKSEVEMQKSVTVFQLNYGKEKLIEEYRNLDSKLSRHAMRQAIYVAIPENKSVQVVLEDLFYDDINVLGNALLDISINPLFPKESIDDRIVQRLFNMLCKDYPFEIKDQVIDILFREKRRNKMISKELNKIYSQKEYRAKGLKNILTNYRVEQKLKEMLH